MIDIHSHLLPGIDDGPKTWEQSIALCRSIVADGVTISVATPHLIDGVYDNTLSRVGPLVEQLNKRLQAENIPLKVLPGAEIDFSSRHVTTLSDDVPWLGGTSAVLLEMPVAVIPPAIFETIFTLRSRSIVPVIAHPERNEVLQDHPSKAQAWLDAGALLQLDAESLLGLWGHRAQRCAEYLLRKQLAHALATDAHSTDKRPPRLTKALQAAEALIGADARKLVNDGPVMILAGQALPAPLYNVTVNAPVNSRESRDRRHRRGGMLRHFFR